MSILQVLEQQGAPGVNVARAYESLAENIRGSELAPVREGRELDALRNDTVERLVAAQADAIAAVDRDEASDLAVEETDRATRAREHRQLGDVVDLFALRTTDSPTELLAIVETAQRAGDALGAEARAIAAKRARQLATTENRRHILPGGRDSALHALVRLTTAQEGRSVDAAGRYELKRRRIREHVAAVARAVGLSAEFARAAGPPRMLPVPETSSKPTLVIGGYWQRFPQLRK